MRRSHIVPEFFHWPGYDEKGRLLRIERDNPPSRFVQQGRKEPLLCRECEQLLNRTYERPIVRSYGRESFRQRSVGDSTSLRHRHAVVGARAVVPVAARDGSRGARGPHAIRRQEDFGVSVLGDPHPDLGHARFAQRSTTRWFGQPTAPAEELRETDVVRRTLPGGGSEV